MIRIPNIVCSLLLSIPLLSGTEKRDVREQNLLTKCKHRPPRQAQLHPPNSHSAAPRTSAQQHTACAWRFEKIMKSTSQATQKTRGDAWHCNFYTDARLQKQIFFPLLIFKQKRQKENLQRPLLF